MPKKTPLQVRHQQLLDDLERSGRTLMDIFKELHNPDLYSYDRHEELQERIAEHKAEEQKYEAIKKEIAVVTRKIAQKENK